MKGRTKVHFKGLQMKATRKLVLVFVMVSFLTMQVLSSMDQGMLFSGQLNQEEVGMIRAIAEDLADPPANARLEGISLVYDAGWQEELWAVRWKTTSRQLIQVELDPSSLRLRYFLDSTKVCDVESYPPESVALSNAWATAFGFLSHIEYKGLVILPQQDNSVDMTKTSDGWTLSFKHTINDIPVRGDFIRISMDPNGKQVYSYASHWHKVVIDTKPEVSVKEAIDTVQGRANGKVFSTQLEIVHVEGKTYLAWVLDSGTEEYWISATTSEILFVDSSLEQPPGSKFTFVSDPGIEITYQCAHRVHRRFETATSFPSGAYAWYHEDLARSQELQLFPYGEVVFHLGHGSGFWREVLGKTFLYTGIGEYGCSDPILPVDLPPEPGVFSSMKLAFISTCWSAADDWEDKDTGIWYPVHTSIVEGFLQRGAQCAIGWDGRALKEPTRDFCDCFFDKAANGFNFWSCYEYAISKSSCQPTIDGARIYKQDTLSWADIFLEEDDAGDSQSIATHLGFGPDADFNVYDEGIWGYQEVWADKDWFSFEVGASCNVEIWLTPKDELHMKLSVYKGATWLFSFRAYERTEYRQFQASPGMYYLRLTMQCGTNYGGGYDLTIHIHS